MSGLDNVQEASALLRAISLASGDAKLSFLVIGGLAVVEHGYGRATEDMDLMIRRSDRIAWTELFGRLGYREWRDGGSFLQFEAASDKGIPLDTMLANDSTFAQLHGAAVRRTMLGVPVLIPCLKHLLAMKLHALRHTRGARGLKDMSDVATLVEINQVDVTASEFQGLCKQFGTPEIYESLKRVFRK